MELQKCETISDVLNDCSIVCPDIFTISETPLFEEMTTLDIAISDPSRDSQGEFLMETTESDINGNEVLMLPEDAFLWSRNGENCPEEVMLEIEVITWDDEQAERTIVDLDNAVHCLESGECSDYGSESGTEHTSDMDLSQGSLDLSRTGPYFNPPIEAPPTTIPMQPPQNASPISPAHSEQNGCLDLSRSANTTPNTYMHYSGGTSISLNGGIINDQAKYYQLPRIKLEPGLGIDPSIRYKPEMDYNHNEHLTPPSLPPAPLTVFEGLTYEQSLNSAIKHELDINSGCENIPRDLPPTLSREVPSEARVTVEPVNLNCIPLTVTSPDDENDSGTESIDSKDSDACNNLNINEGVNQQKTDRKRPGRKKGQVSKVYHLWEFIRDVLNDPRYCGKVIKWENEDEGIFRVVQSEIAATMWGQKKNNRTKMTYEKMSRSIRYSRKEGYFDDLPKDKGYPKKLCFKFGKKAHGWNTNKKVLMGQGN